MIYRHICAILFKYYEKLHVMPTRKVWDSDDITLRRFILDFYTLILSKNEASSSKCISEIESFENKSDKKLMREMMIFTKNYFSAAMNSLNHKGKPSLAVARNWIKSNPRQIDFWALWSHVWIHNQYYVKSNCFTYKLKQKTLRSKSLGNLLAVNQLARVMHLMKITK